MLAAFWTTPIDLAAVATVIGTIAALMLFYFWSETALMILDKVLGKPLGRIVGRIVGRMKKRN